MYPFDYLAWSNNHKYDDLIRQADELRKLNEAFRPERSINKGKSRLLALLARELGNIGFSLEMRYDSRPEPRQTLDPQGDLSGCP
jgi:hypothetical protein